MSILFRRIRPSSKLGQPLVLLRIPSHVLSAEIVSEYCEDDCLSFDIKNKNLILSFRTDDEDGDWIDGEGWLSSLIDLRADLINGDHRCLYLAWLRFIQGWQSSPPLLKRISQLARRR